MNAEELASLTLEHLQAICSNIGDHAKPHDGR